MILSKIPFEIAALIVQRMEKKYQEVVIDALPSERGEAIRLHLKYPEGTAGSLMAPKVLFLIEDEIVREALKRVKKHPEQTVYYLYIVNREHLLVGFLNIWELIQADPNSKISDIMHEDIGCLSPKLSYQAILSHPAWKEHYSLPVADEKGIFLGVIDYKVLRRIEQKSLESKSVLSNRTDAALVELYWVGLSGLVNWALSGIRGPKK
jgi:magnesium transporter